MPVLKFNTTDQGIILEGFRLEDITTDKRTFLLNKKAFISDEYKIDTNVYLVLNDMFFKIANFFDKSKTPISAILIREESDNIIIVPSRSYVFWKGRSVDPVEYKILHSEADIIKLLRVSA